MKEGVLEKVKYHWKQLTQEAQTVRYKKGQVLFYEGHLPYGLYILKVGDLFFTRSEKKCHNDHLSRIGKDRVVCIESILTQKPNLCTCYAKTDCDVLFISKIQLSHCLDENSQGQ